MNRFSYQSENDNAGFCVVENIFINEYLPRANGDYVKVYLMGLKNAQSAHGEALSTGQIARLLDLTESDVLKAWSYWESQHIIRIESSGTDRTIIFLNITSQMYAARGSRKKTETAAPGDKRFADTVDAVQHMFGGEPLPMSYIKSFKEWMSAYHFEPETIILLAEHALTCMTGGHFSSSTRLKYLNTIAENWRAHDIRTYKQAETYLMAFQKQARLVQAVLRELGQSRRPLKWEREMVAAWQEQWGFDETMILEATRRSQSPNMNYVNAILGRWHENGWTKPEQIVNTIRAPRTPAQPARERLAAVEAFEEAAYALSDEEIAALKDEGIDV